jgi:hypothetical protein
MHDRPPLWKAWFTTGTWERNCLAIFEIRRLERFNVSVDRVMLLSDSEGTSAKARESGASRDESLLSSYALKGANLPDWGLPGHQGVLRQGSKVL